MTIPSTISPRSRAVALGLQIMVPPARSSPWTGADTPCLECATVARLLKKKGRKHGQGNNKVRQ